MATIYRFIVEQKVSSTGSGRTPKDPSSTGKGAAKKGKWVSMIGGGEKGGVEHNRKMRAINPLLNRMTGGAWEKGMRLGRAGAGLIQRNTETGKIRASGTAIAIIIAFVIQTVLKVQQRQIAEQQKINEQNFKALENGVGAIHGEYSVTRSAWNGRVSYNQNK